MTDPTEVLLAELDRIIKEWGDDGTLRPASTRTDPYVAIVRALATFRASPREPERTRLRDAREVAHEGMMFDCPALGHFTECDRMTAAIERDRNSRHLSTPRSTPPSHVVESLEEGEHDRLLYVGGAYIPHNAANCAICVRRSTKPPQETPCEPCGGSGQICAICSEDFDGCTCETFETTLCPNCGGTGQRQP